MATPLDRNLKIDADSGTAVCDPTQYRQINGSLIYLTITQPDLSYSVGLLSQFMQHPRNLHHDCAKRILQYVSATMDYGIMYKSDPTIRLEGYTDAAGQAIKRTDDRHPVSYSPSAVERSPGAARSSRQSRCQAQKPNTGARQSLRVRPCEAVCANAFRPGKSISNTSIRTSRLLTSSRRL